MPGDSFDKNILHVLDVLVSLGVLGAYSFCLRICALFCGCFAGCLRAFCGCLWCAGVGQKAQTIAVKGIARWV